MAFDEVDVFALLDLCDSIELEDTVPPVRLGHKADKTRFGHRPLSRRVGGAPRSPCRTAILLVSIVAFTASCASTMAPSAENCFAPRDANSHMAASLGHVFSAGPRLCVGTNEWRVHAGSFDGSMPPAEIVQRAQALKLNTIRVVDWLPAEGDPTVAAFDASSWQRVDAIVAAADVAGLHVILDFSTYRNLLAAFTSNPYAADWNPFLEFAANRINTSNGNRYGSDPTIALVAFAGEVEPPSKSPSTGVTTEQIVDFFNRVFFTWKAVAPHQLTSTGGLLHLDWESGIDWRTIMALNGSDVCSIHVYSSRDQEIALPAVASYCAMLKKPWILEEFGWNARIGDELRARRFDEMYGLTGRHAAAGAGFWNVGPETGDTFDVNSKTPNVVQVVRRHAPPTSYMRLRWPSTL